MAAEKKDNSNGLEQASPLYLHPNESTLVISEKLVGTTNYRSCRRTLEIMLAGRRKLGFVNGLVVRDKEDTKKQELWDPCNNVVIGWLHANVSETIKKSVLYLSTAKAVWQQLERRFSVTNGTHKYKLNRGLYDTQQNGVPINEYFTKMCCIWEELDNVNQSPLISEITPEIAAYIQFHEKKKEEERLFHFLFGLDEDLAAQRSQILMNDPLPSVEEESATLQQEELQREVYNMYKMDMEASAMLTKRTGQAEDYYAGKKPVSKEYCDACGKRGHSVERCWTVIGYPEGHPKAKTQWKNLKKEGQKWNKPRGAGGRMAAIGVANQGECSNQHQALTSYQIEQLLKLIPSDPKAAKLELDSEEDADTPFSGLTFTDH